MAKGKGKPKNRQVAGSVPRTRATIATPLSEAPEPTLQEVRREALAKLKGTCGVYKVCDGDPARLCQGQHYGGTIGMGGVGKGLAFAANVSALDRIRLKTRLLVPHQEPDLGQTYLDRKLALPVMASSTSGMRASLGGAMEEIDFATAVLLGSREAGTLGWLGNTPEEGQELAGVRAMEAAGPGIPIFKPQANQRLKELFSKAEAAGAVAVGVDLDGVGSTHWERAGKPVFRKSPEELEELVRATSLPFIAKGLMGVEDALDCVEAGVAAIDVSNHGGRALESTRGVAEILPEIAEAVEGQCALTAGGGVRTGFDVLKMLALGADAVLIGRDLIRAAVGGGAQGVKLHFDYLASDLRRGMMLTGVNTVAEIDGRVLDR